MTLGARILTESEIKKTLATYDTIFNQIELFRENVEELSEKDIDMTPQKINNIAILGKRGTGKTSILRTIRETLKKEDKKDILLPIIIPENMSQNNSLMSSIIGMFSDIVKQYKNENYVNDCIGNRKAKNELEEKYNDVVKQFCYIQPQYKHILMDNFISELEYTKKSSQIFNADQEFIKKFHRFINALLKNCEEKKSMIFVFIDDIDLSTNRCMDVVKTLLSYISHPNIVTFLSGDLDTFEEAIAIDFLRQEQAFSEKVWNGKFINETSLLERKKELAYEYLKKVAPPIYRHNIKYWSLKDRGNYFIAQNEEDTSKEITLYKMLRKLEEKEFQKERFFTMYSEQETDKVLPLTYHLFDETARGLNNVYAVLYDMYQKWINEKDIDYTDKRNLIDTMISANPVLNGLRDNIDSIVHFNVEQEDVYIRYDNFVIYINEVLDIKQDKVNDKINNTTINDSSVGKIYIKNIGNAQLNVNKYFNKNNKNESKRKSIFILFLFLEFIKKLFEQDTSYFSQYNYIISKIKAIKLLLLTPSLNESNTFIKKEMEEYINRIIPNDASNNSDDFFIHIIRTFLINGNFLLSLHFYEKLVELDYNFYKLYQKEISNTKLDLTIKVQKAFESFLCVENDFNEKVRGYLSKNYETLKSGLNLIQSFLAGTEDTIKAEILFEPILKNKETVLKKVLLKEENYKNQVALEIINKFSELTYENFVNLRNKLFFNYIIKYYKDVIFEETLNNEEIKNVSMKSFEKNKSFLENFDGTKYEKQYKIIKKIEKGELWSSPILKKAIADLENSINKYLEQKLIPNLQYISLENKDFKIKLEEFDKCYDGISDTIAKKEKYKLREIEFLPSIKGQQYEKQKESYKIIQYASNILDIIFYGRGWYGKEEARALNNEIYKLTWEKVENDNKNSEEVFKLHLYFYALYRKNELMANIDNIIKAKQFDNIIDEARMLYRNTTENEFISVINEDKTEIQQKNKQQYSIRDIETLFEELNEKNQEGES